MARFDNYIKVDENGRNRPPMTVQILIDAAIAVAVLEDNKPTADRQGRGLIINPFST
jgi:hypothetical protein